MQKSFFQRYFPDVPRAIWVLGFVSLLMDLSSEMIHALLPVYITTTLNASAISLGLIEGGAEALALFTKIFSGTLSDWLGKKKFLAATGYTISALTKPIFPLSNTVYGVLFARLSDRVGKGIRGAPRDALIGEIAPTHARGACYGLRQSLDTVGAFLGPLVAVILLAFVTSDVRFVFWVATVPAVASALLIIFAVRDPQSSASARSQSTKKIHLALAKEFPPELWHTMLVAFILTLARFSEGFLILRAQALEVPFAFLPATLIIMNVAYAFTSYPAGKIADAQGRDRVLIYGIILLICSDLFLSFSTNWISLGVGVCLWGIHLGFTQGVLSAKLSDHAPPHLLGTAFGVMNFGMGLAMLIGNVIAGALWEWSGASGTYLAGALISFVSLVVVLSLKRQIPSKA